MANPHLTSPYKGEGFKALAIYIVLTLLLSPLNLHAADSLDYSSFSRIPILHEGRIKPLGSFARVMFKHISGQSSSKSNEWLAHVLFAPSGAVSEPIFLVRSPELIRMLSLPARKDAMYSFSELAAAIATQQSTLAALAGKDKKNLTASEQELVNLTNNVNDFAELLGTFSLLAALPDTDAQTRHLLGMPSDATLTYLNLLRKRKNIETMQENTLRRKKDRINSYTPDELRIARLSARLTLMEAMDRGNSLVRVIPPFWEGSEEWLSPWAVMEKSMGSPQSAKLFAQWQALAAAYQTHDAAAWQQNTQALFAAGANAPGVRPWALSLEVIYNDYNLLGKCLMVYGLAFAFAAAGLWRRSPRWLMAAYAALFLGGALHGIAIAMRMLILMRPPVSTLYESMIFVSFIAVFFSLWLERRRKGADGLLISSAIACLLLAAANVFAADSDTLEVLVAVLNTNFWLATHVVCITTGYGSSLVAGTLAHLYLFRRATGTGEDLAILQRRIHSVALVALLFTAVGTMLGGIWADQSWGRFWGWDPKENGALWIVLWLIWLLHGRVSQQMGILAFSVGMALLNIVVALAWVGVNLLNVGLHSYGFTDTAANGLLAFCGIELAFIAITFCVILHRKLSRTTVKQL